MKKRIFKCVLFFSLFICIGYLLNQTLLLKRPDGVTPMQDLYQAPTDSVDVLCIGSSHMGMSLSAAAMWEQEGIAAYGLWGSIQPFWNSYYNLKEALRFQSPKLVILEVYAASFTDEYSDEARQYSNLGGMNPNFTKWEAVTVSAPRDRWSTLFLNYPSYHTRYLELTEDDVSSYFWNTPSNDKHLSATLLSVGTVSTPIVQNPTVRTPLMKKQQTYLLKIISLLKEREIPLLLICAPDTSLSTSIGYYNTVADLAQANDVPFIDYNFIAEEIGFDWAADISSDNGHVNYYGAQKITSHLVDYLHDHYNLPDRREDIRYSSYDAYCLEENNLLLKQCPDMATYRKFIFNTEQYSYILIKNGAMNCPADSEPFSSLKKAGFPVKKIQSCNFSFCVVENKSVTFKKFSDTAKNISAVVDSLSLRFLKDTCSVIIDGKEITRVEQNTLSLLVYDTHTKKVVDIVRFSPQTNYTLTR